MLVIDEIKRTPAEQVLEIFVTKDGRPPGLETPFLYKDNKVVSSNGSAICWTHMELCSGTYSPAEKLPPAFESLFNNVPILHTIEYVAEETITKLVGDNKADFRPSNRQCKQCKGDGYCDQCDCAASHECGKCDGVGSFPVDPRLLIGIGTGIFSYSVVCGLLLAASTQNLHGFTYRGSSENKYLQHFTVGDCHLILASERCRDEQEVVKVPTTPRL